MAKNIADAFDELLQQHYGALTRSGPSTTEQLARLFANNYGIDAKGRKRKPAPAAPRPMALSLSCDDGEMLRQRSAGQAATLSRSASTPAWPEEYVVGDAAIVTQASVEVAEALTPDEVGVLQEYRVDLLDPLHETTHEPQHRAVPHPDLMARAGTPSASITQDELLADMKSILSGERVYDPGSKSVVERTAAGSPGAARATPAPAPLPAPDARSTAIFDRIAQSMQYANAYDLGTVELENRFANFDQLSELQERQAARKRQEQKRAREAPAEVKVGSSDFLEDMDAIQSLRTPWSAATEAPPDGGTATDAEIEALNLADSVKKAAYALKKKHPAVTFTSGRRTKHEQAYAMAGNVVENRKWIEETYVASKVRDACQKWVNDHADKKTKDEIGAGLAEVLDGFTDAEAAVLSKHLSGMAFDVQPVTADADAIKKSIKGLEGLDKFLEKEGGLVRWHAQFK